MTAQHSTFSQREIQSNRSCSPKSQVFLAIYLVFLVLAIAVSYLELFHGLNDLLTILFIFVGPFILTVATYVAYRIWWRIHQVKTVLDGKYIESNEILMAAPNPNKQPIDILKERYARGEISKEQLKEMKRDILI